MKPKKKTKTKRPVTGHMVKEPVPVSPAGASRPSPEKNGVFRFLGAVALALAAYQAVLLLQPKPANQFFKVRVLSRIVGEGKPCGPFSSWGIAPIGRDGVCLADAGHNRLLEFDRKGSFIRGWGKLGKGPGEFHEPSGMTSDGEGNAYVMDTWNGAIKGFNEEGREILDLPLGSGGFFGPRGIAYDGKSFVIADTGNNRIVLMSPRGKIEAAWGKYGDKPGQFKGPLAVAADGKGNYFVADSGNHRLQWLDRNGKVVKIIRCGGSVPAVAVDQEGRIYVAADTVDENGLKVYGPQGDYLGVVRDQQGFGDYFEDVQWMSISPKDVLMVSDGNSAFLFQVPGNDGR